MTQALDEALRRLYEYVSRPELEPELKKAKAEFFGQVGSPLSGEPIEELRLGSLSEWFIFDRPLPGPGYTPLERYLRHHGAELEPELVAAFQGLARQVHGVFLIKKRTEHGALLLDLYTGQKYKDVQRLHLTLGKGDLAELRLVPIADAWSATDALCYHPVIARKQIEKIMKKAKKENQPLKPLLLKLMAKNTRFERSPRTVKAKVYGELL